MKEKCVLYDRDCIDCGECMFCDLDPTKICDNCGKCIEGSNLDFAAIKIDGIDGVSKNNKDLHSHDKDCDCDDCNDFHNDDINDRH